MKHVWSLLLAFGLMSCGNSPSKSSDEETPKPQDQGEDGAGENPPKPLPAIELPGPGIPIDLIKEPTTEEDLVFLCQLVETDKLISFSINEGYQVADELIKSRLSKINSKLYEPMDFQIGEGYIYGETTPREVCVEFDSSDLVDEQGAPYALVEDSEPFKSRDEADDIFLREDFAEFWQSDVEFDFAASQRQGAFLYDFEMEPFIFSRSVRTFSAYVKADYPLAFNRTGKLKPDMLALYHENPVAFTEKCGTHYIEGHDHKQRVGYTLFTVPDGPYDHLGKELVEKFDSILTGSSRFILEVRDMFDHGFPVYMKWHAFGVGELYERSSGRIETITTVEEAEKLSAFMYQMEASFKPTLARSQTLVSRSYEALLDNSDGDNSESEARLKRAHLAFQRGKQLSQWIYRLDQEIKHLEFDNSWAMMCKFANKKTGLCGDFLQSLNQKKEELSLQLKELERIALTCADASSKGCELLPPIEEPKLWLSEYEDTLRNSIEVQCVEKTEDL